MSEPIKTAPIGGPKLMCGHGSADQSEMIAKAIQDFVGALGGLFSRSKEDEGPTEPEALVTITKTTVTYEFDAEALGRTAVKTLGAIVRGFKWPEATQPTPDNEASEDLPDDNLCGGFPAPSPSVAEFAATFSDLTSLEGPDGRLKPEFAKAIAVSLLGSRAGKEAAQDLAVSMVNALAPAKHRQQLLEELARVSSEARMSEARMSEARILEAAQKRQAAEAAVREARGPIITPPPAPEPPKDAPPKA